VREPVGQAPHVESVDIVRPQYRPGHGAATCAVAVPEYTAKNTTKSTNSRRTDMIGLRVQTPLVRTENNANSQNNTNSWETL
jgi:hypothetical protein